jgi:ADP-ribosylglycohydrolase
VLAAALSASKAAEALRPPTRPRTIAESLDQMHADLSRNLPLNADYVAEKYFPDSPETIVPLAISLALLTESAESTTLMAANIGGDSDSVASIGSAIAAALRPETVNESWFQVVNTVNRDGIVEVALALSQSRFI